MPKAPTLAAAPASPDREWFTADSLAEWLGVPIGTVRNWAYRGEGPARHRLAGGNVRYRRADVEAWLAEQRIGA